MMCDTSQELERNELFCFTMKNITIQIMMEYDAIIKMTNEVDANTLIPHYLSIFL